MPNQEKDMTMKDKSNLCFLVLVKFIGYGARDYTFPLLITQRLEEAIALAKDVDGIKLNSIRNDQPYGDRGAVDRIWVYAISPDNTYAIKELLEDDYEFRINKKSSKEALLIFKKFRETLSCHSNSACGGCGEHYGGQGDWIEQVYNTAQYLDQ